MISHPGLPITDCIAAEELNEAGTQLEHRTAEDHATSRPKPRFLPGQGERYLFTTPSVA